MKSPQATFAIFSSLLVLASVHGFQPSPITAPASSTARNSSQQASRLNKSRSRSSNNNSSRLNVFGRFGTKEEQAVIKEIVDPSYNLALGSLVLGVLSAQLVVGVGAVLILFAAFLAFQTTNLRFTFDNTSFSLVKEDTEESRENIVVGGANSWKYNSIVNWGFLPSKEFPILVYFKEVQTPTDGRNNAPIIVDDLAGQAHFFPAIANTKQLEERFTKYNCEKVEK